ncbi:MAG: hypothetical protein KTR21_13720 [Rhodobacteraceae bacterium]|nr:hypothetical protein [Paracoccaceae bacterium]
MPEFVLSLPELAGPTDTSDMTVVDSLTITEDGLVLENVIVQGRIKVEADNVTIRNVVVDSGFSSHYSIQIVDGYSGTVIEHSELMHAKSAAIYGAGFTASFNNIHDTEGDGIKPIRDAVIENNWIHHLGRGEGAHADGVQVVSGSNFTIRDNYFDMPITDPAPYKTNAAIFMTTNNNEITDVVIDGNIMNGGNYTLVVDDKDRGHGAPSEVTITNNVFGPDYRYGTSNINAVGLVEENNIEVADLAEIGDLPEPEPEPVPLPQPEPTPSPEPEPTPLPDDDTPSFNRVVGDALDNLIQGGQGPDWLDGDAGDDTLRADAGNDEAYGGVGADIIRGGAGDDIVYGQDGDDIVLSGDRGDDTIHGGSGSDVLRGGADNDMLYGDEGDDRLVGDRGDDMLYGGQGDDVLIGHFGDDYLIGGDGVDRLTGGDGADTFKLEGAQGVDLIADFQQGADKIDLSFYDIGSFDQLQMQTAGAGGVKIDLADHGGETVILRNVEVDELTSDDFVI